LSKWIWQQKGEKEGQRLSRLSKKRGGHGGKLEGYDLFMADKQKRSEWKGYTGVNLTAKHLGDVPLELDVPDRVFELAGTVGRHEKE